MHKRHLHIFLIGGIILCSFPVTAGLVIGPNVNISRMTNNQTETTIAVDPAQSQNLFAAANGGYDYSSRAPLPMVYYYSTNAGANWNLSDVSSLPVSCCDPSSAWDSLGNLFLCYLAVNGPAVLALSTNGGANFILLYQSAGFPDQPTVVIGPGGTNAPGSVWLTYADSISGNLVAQGAAVNGRGDVGVFGTNEPALPGGSYGDIAIGPEGQVLVAYQSNLGSAGPDTISVNLDPDGLGPAGFDNATAATPTEVGGLLAIPAQLNRKIDAEAGLAWDRSGGTHHGRLYLVYTDRPNTSSLDTDIHLRYSDDNGSTWSGPLRVNDDPVGNGKSQFLPRIAVDQATGNVGISFYDCRNSAANNTAEYWAAVSNDGGRTVLPNLKVSTGVSSANVIAVSAYKFDFGDYSGLAFSHGLLHPCWGDNSNSTADNPEGAHTTLEIYTAAVLVPPTLQIERTPTNTLVLAWSSSPPGFLLLESPTGLAGTWITNSASPATIGGQSQLVIDPAITGEFYRLFKP